MKVSYQYHTPAALTQRNNTVTYWTRGWVGPRAGLEVLGREKFLTPPGLELQVVQPVALSLHQPRYPCSWWWWSSSW